MRTRRRISPLRVVRLVLLLVGALSLLASTVVAHDEEAAPGGHVVVLPTNGIVDQIMSEYLRAGIARAMALDPDILFLDEPLGGLDPISARRLDDLVLELRDSLGTTVVIVTHELASLLYIGNNSVFLDAETKTMIAAGDPKQLLRESADPRVRAFLSRGAA